MVVTLSCVFSSVSLCFHLCVPAHPEEPGGLGLLIPILIQTNALPTFGWGGGGVPDEMRGSPSGVCTLLICSQGVQSAPSHPSPRLRTPLMG